MSESYASTVPSAGGLERFSGFTLLKEGAPHQVHAPRGEKGRALIRVLPEIRENAEMPWRMTSDRCDFSNWIRAEKLIRMAGVNNKFTAFCRVLGKDRKYAGPIQRFADTMYNAIKNSPTSLPPEWIRWKDKQGALPGVEYVGLLQVMLFENAGFVNRDNVTGKYKPVTPVLFVMPKSARMAVEALCDTEVDGFAGNSDDFSSRYKIGDPCSTSAGRMLQCVYVPQNGAMLSHYAVTPLQAVPIPFELAKKSFRPWDDVLNYLTEEQQMELLIDHFPPEAVDYVFGQTVMADLMPKVVRGKWLARMNQRAGFAAYGQPQQPQQPQAGYGQMPAQQLPPQQYYEPPQQVQPAAPMPAPARPPAPATAQAAPAAGNEGYEFSLGDEASDSIPFDSGVNVNPPVTSPAVQQPFQTPQTTATEQAKQRLAEAQALLRAKQSQAPTQPQA